MDKDRINNITYTYLIIPIIIFLFGWCKYVIAFPIAMLLVISIVYRFKKYNENNYSIFYYIKKHKIEILVMMLIAGIYVFLSGIGGYVYQNYDHLFRNAIFEDLVEYDWPVYLEPQGMFKNSIIFIYYFALWLPAACIGKIFGISVGYYAFYLWCTIGVFLTFLHIKNFFKGNYLIPIILFIFFSGLDIVEKFLYGESLMNMIFSSKHIEWIGAFQMSSFTTQLFWVFNQAIPAWLITLFMLNEKDNRYMGVMYCTLPAAGLGFVFIYKVFFDNLIEVRYKSKIKRWLKSTFTWQNIVIGIPVLVILYLFLKSNTSGGKIHFGVSESRILNVLIIYIFEFVIYYALVYKYCKKKSLFWISMISLIICPLISVGNGQDFCMRACIPGQVIMFTFVIESLYEAYRKKDRVILCGLVIVLMIGSITPLNEIKRTIQNTNEDTEMSRYNLATSSCAENFYGYKDKSLFVKYIAR